MKYCDTNLQNVIEIKELFNKENNYYKKIS
jgi:hypothetical protein